ncbi:MAG: phage tail tape measure protein [Bacteroidales bacterium]
MSTNTTYSYNILFETGNIIPIIEKIGILATKAAQEIEKCSFMFNSLHNPLQSFQSSFHNTIVSGVALNSSMKGLSTVIEQTGKGLEKMEKYTRQTAKTFGGNASQAAESYKLILSQLSIEISKCPNALKAMGDSAAINQFQIATTNSLEGSKKMRESMNVMAAAAQEGFAKLSSIQQVLEQSAMAAKALGGFFAESNSAMQMFDKTGKKVAEGGVALRNVMATLSQGRFLPNDVQEELQAAGVCINSLGDTSKTLSDRLNPLKAVMGDAALSTKLFGKENVNTAISLISGTEQMNTWIHSILVTNSAIYQAGIVMGSYAEKISCLKAKMEDLKISICSISKGSLPFLQGAITAIQVITNVFSIVCDMQILRETVLGKAILFRAKATKTATVAMWSNVKAMFTSLSSLGAYSIVVGIATVSTYAFSTALKALGKAIYSIPIVGWIAGGISLLVGGFILLWNKSEKFRQVFFTIGEVIKTVFYNIGLVITNLYNSIVKPFVLFFLNLFKGLALGIFSAIKWCWDNISQGLSSLGSFFVGIWNWIVESVQSVFSSLGQVVMKIWEWISTKAKGVASTLVGVFTWIAKPIKKVFTSIGTFFSVVWDKIIKGLSKPFEWIRALWNKVFPKDQFKKIGDTIVQGKKKGSESWNKDHQAKSNGRKSVQISTNPLSKGIASPISLSTTANTKTIFSTSKKQGKSKSATRPSLKPGLSLSSPSSSSSKSEVLNLNNIKRSSSYEAIVAKLKPNKIQGLGREIQAVKSPFFAKKESNFSTNEQGLATNIFTPVKSPQDTLTTISKNVQKIAASLAFLSFFSLSMQLPVQASSEFISMPGREENSTSLIAKERESRFAKFCDQVVINVPSGTTQVQVDAIIKELMHKINSAAQ